MRASVRIIPAGRSIAPVFLTAPPIIHANQADLCDSMNPNMQMRYAHAGNAAAAFGAGKLTSGLKLVAYAQNTFGKVTANRGSRVDRPRSAPTAVAS